MLVKKREGIPVDQQRLIFRGGQLGDEDVLESIGLIEDRTVHLCLRLRGGMYAETSGKNGNYGAFLRNIYGKMAGPCEAIPIHLYLVMQDQFFVRHNGKFTRVRIPEILYIEASKNYCRLVTEKEVYLLLTTLTKFKGILPEEEFCQVHRSFIVSLAHINAFTQDEMQLEGKQVPIGNSYRSELFKRVTILSSDNGRSRLRTLNATPAQVAAN